MIKINLLSEGKRPTAVRKAKPAAALTGAKDVGQWMLVLGLFLGVAAAGANWWLLDRELKATEAKVAAAEAEVKKLESVIQEVEEFKTKKATLENKIKVITDLKTNQRGPVQAMDSVSRALPELLWLDKMRMTASSIEIEGRAFNPNAVANFIENLERMKDTEIKFEEPTLKDTQEQQGGVYRFALNFNYSFASKAPEAGAVEGAAADGATPAAAVQPASR